MKRIFTAILLLTVALQTRQASAQQDAMYSQYMFNTLAINPAYAGSRNVISATGLLRKQWAGIEAAPQTATFTVDAPFNNKKVGVGLQLFSDKLGITKTTGIIGSYAYRIRMEKGSLSFGLQGSVTDFRADYSSVALDPYGTSTDPAFMDNIQRAIFNAGAGLYYNSDKFYLGLSSPELFSNKINGSATANGVSKQAVHVFLAAGYVFPLTDDFQLKPSVLFKGVQGAPLQADLNGTLWIKNMVAIGVQYRTSADISGLVELQINPQIRLGYQYDHSITNLQNYNTGSHEIMLRYEFGSSKSKILTPRYF